MTSMEAKLGEESVRREEPASRKGTSATDHLRVLARALPSADNPSEQAVFATAFVRELETSSPESAYLKAIEVLSAFRQAEARYREGRLERSPGYR